MVKKATARDLGRTLVDGAPVELQDVATHRNGIGGEAFDVVTFTHAGRAMVAVLFEKEAGEDERTAVFDLALLADGVIAFGANSWRGDVYGPVLRRLVNRRRRGR